MGRHAIACSLIAAFSIGCGAASQPITGFPHGQPIELLEGPVHLGDDAAGGQAFSSGRARAARVCSLVNMPETRDVYLQVAEVRHTETLANQLTVNGTPFPLPVTLERDPHDRAPNAMSASPVQRVRLEQGPSEICLTAGHKTNGDIDDFEVAGLTLFVEGISIRDIGVRRGLSQGTPIAPTPPSEPWGKRQNWPTRRSPSNAPSYPGYAR